MSQDQESQQEFSVNNETNELLNELVDQIINNDVTLVVGPELSIVREGKEIANLYDKVRPDLLKEVSNTWKGKCDFNDPQWNFKDIADFVEGDAGKKRIAGYIQSLYGRADLDYLDKLVAMGFDTYISVTPDSWLTKALQKKKDKAENGAADFYEFNYHNTSMDAPRDDLELENKAIVLNLLGSVNANKTGFACSNIDILDWLYTFYKHSTEYQKCEHSVLAKVLDRVETKSNLLFIGCDFPDWLFCLLCRALNLGNLREEKFTKFISHNNLLKNQKLSTTLEYIKAGIYIDDQFYKTSCGFVDRLYAAWSWRQKDLSFKKKEVFLCFSSKDREFVGQVYRYLSVEKGMQHVWYDDKKMGTGDAYVKFISRAISSVKVFVMFLSKNTTQSLSEAYFPKEWELARHEYDSRELPEKLSVLAYVIDDTGFPDFEKVLPVRFKEKVNTRLFINGHDHNLKAVYDDIRKELDQ
ncbi:toll/interleukin-1 receptor domain-containing protein [Negadavirga shengliensis]|uniref:Toll/interleukin-1 receptor domain-containing protein n=1 Tax=Negadavirga shengliensis TaxID=1389218 RepID=A0ABV9SVA4_9BACT